MTRLFRSKSCGLTEFRPQPSSITFFSETDDEDSDDISSHNPISTPFISTGSRCGGGGRGRSGNSNSQFTVLDMMAAALRKSLVITCSVEREDVISSMDISWPTEVRHVSHVTFDRFNGFLGLPSELETEISRKVPSCSAKVFGVSAKSMQCSYDDRGNSVPTILLLMQRHLYVEGGLKAEGIFRINAENSHEEYVRDQLNNGIVPRGIDVHCLAGLIKAWFRELPSGILDSLTPEQVMHCNTEDDCVQLVRQLPPTEASLLDWAINLMADVVDHEQYNKMNARNVAMVFAPNMTQMADPLTALIHAVQVMNLLKTLIIKTLGEREELSLKVRMLSTFATSSNDNNESCQSDKSREFSINQYVDNCTSMPMAGKATESKLQPNIGSKLWNFRRKADKEEETGSISNSSQSSSSGIEERNDDGNQLNLKNGARRLYKRPIFQLSKMSTNKTSEAGTVNTREGGGEAWT